MVTPASHRIPRVRQYSRSYLTQCIASATGLSPSPDGSSNTVRLTIHAVWVLRNTPQIDVQPPTGSGSCLNTPGWVWAPPGSLAATTGIFSFPRGTLDVSVPPVPPAYLCRSVICLQMGLPHSDSSGSQAASASPKHFAAWPRPSSAVSAKASTMCSSVTMSPFSVSFHVWYGARGDTSVSTTLADQGDPLRFSMYDGLRSTGGAAGTRTPDLRRARAALSQLSYGPMSPPTTLTTVPSGGRAWTRTRDLGLIRAAL